MAINERLQDVAGAMLSSLDQPAPLPAKKSDAIRALKAEALELEARILHMELRNQPKVDHLAEVVQATKDYLNGGPDPSLPKPSLRF